VTYPSSVAFVLVNALYTGLITIKLAFFVISNLSSSLNCVGDKLLLADFLKRVLRALFISLEDPRVKPFSALILTDLHHLLLPLNDLLQSATIRIKRVR